MNKDGRKEVTIRSALTVLNQLTDAVLVNLDNNQSPFGGMFLEPQLHFRTSDILIDIVCKNRPFHLCSEVIFSIPLCGNDAQNP